MRCFWIIRCEGRTRSWRSFACGEHPALTFVLSGLSKIAGLPQMKAAWIAALGPEAVAAEALGRLEIVADTFLSMNAPVQLALPSGWPGAGRLQAQILERARGTWRRCGRLRRRLRAAAGAGGGGWVECGAGAAGVCRGGGLRGATGEGAWGGGASGVVLWDGGGKPGGGEFDWSGGGVCGRHAACHCVSFHMWKCSRIG